MSQVVRAGRLAWGSFPVGLGTAMIRITLNSLRELQQDRFVLLEILIPQPPGQGRRRQHPAHLQVLFCPCHPFSWRLNPPKQRLVHRPSPTAGRVSGAA